MTKRIIPDGFLTVTEASSMLGISKTWIYKLFESGKLKKYKRMGKTLVLQKDIEALAQVRADD